LAIPYLYQFYQLKVWWPDTEGFIERLIMEADTIKNKLKENGKCMSRVAEDLRVSVAAVSYVIHKRSVSRRIMNHIAQTIGRPVEDVFPIYNRIGKPRRIS